MAQLEAVLATRPRTVYCEFEDPKRYREAVTRFRDWQKGMSCPSGIFVVPPRIFKMGEDWILKQVRSCEADGYLIRNYDHLKYFSDTRRIGDFSLNVANGLTAEYFLTRYGLERVTASYDLNFSQLEALLRSSPPEWYEVTVHQHMPMFHMEHCVFCAVLSPGTNKHNCGRPCDVHEVKLRDRIGQEHRLVADVGCRNTLFNAVAQSGAEIVPQLLGRGIRHFRIELLDDRGPALVELLALYRRLLAGEATGHEVWTRLKATNRVGVTRGTLEERRNPLAIL